MYIHSFEYEYLCELANCQLVMGIVSDLKPVTLQFLLFLLKGIQSLQLCHLENH